MDVIRAKIILKKIKCSLVFFCVLSFLQCAMEEKVQNLVVIYKEGKAVGVDFNSDLAPSELKCFLEGEEETAVLGSISALNDHFHFKPAIPLSSGQSYELRNGNALLATFTIKKVIARLAPELSIIYPTRDTLPENLLKIYLQFSQPMQEVGEVLDYISVVDETEDKEVSIFLELKTGLWNRTHDRLTLWLDPGRIKTDLIPNKEKGLPLIEQHNYSLRISDEWKSAKGVPLQKNYQKKFYVTKRDNTIPSPSSWILGTPKANSLHPLLLNFGESLDAILASESLKVETSQGKEIQGKFIVLPKELGIEFIPVKPWNKDSYNILIQSKLEDLAGNNLNRLFDTDLHNQTNLKVAEPIKRKSFKIF